MRLGVRILAGFLCVWRVLFFAMMVFSEGPVCIECEEPPNSSFSSDRSRYEMAVLWYQPEKGSTYIRRDLSRLCFNLRPPQAQPPEFPNKPSTTCLFLRLALCLGT